MLYKPKRWASGVYVYSFISNFSWELRAILAKLHIVQSIGSFIRITRTSSESVSSIFRKFGLAVRLALFEVSANESEFTTIIATLSPTLFADTFERPFRGLQLHRKAIPLVVAPSFTSYTQPRHFEPDDKYTARLIPTLLLWASHYTPFGYLYVCFVNKRRQPVKCGVIVPMDFLSSLGIQIDRLYFCIIGSCHFNWY
jgi:hypothetical protein